jgi:hypothetical protein
MCIWQAFRGSIARAAVSVPVITSAFSASLRPPEEVAPAVAVAAAFVVWRAVPLEGAWRVIKYATRINGLEWVEPAGAQLTEDK